MPRTTMRRAATLEGVGVHTGARSRITIGPGEPGEGFVFVSEGTRIPATPENVSSSDRRTDLSSGGKTVMTTEHILSALVGMGLDDATVVVEGPEIPFFDGSALPLAKAIAETGLAEVPGEPERITLDQEVELRFGNTVFKLWPSEGLRITCIIEYDHPFIPEQKVGFAISSETYLREIAPARTYIFREEAEEILARGLGKGGSLDCVLVINRDGYMNEPRFPDEPARHKLMDMLGDLALVRARLDLAIEAKKPGHRTNHALADFIRENGERNHGL